jgi:hypothetical protein
LDDSKVLLTLAGPVETGHAKPGSCDLGNVDIGVCQGTLDGLEKRCLEAVIADGFPIPCTSATESNNSTTFVCNNGVAFGATNIYAEEIIQISTFRIGFCSR